MARDDDVHVAAVGHKAFGDREPIGRDAIFRIASLTKPIVGVAAMLLIQDGAMALDDPVGRWLPELAEPRVLRSLDAELDDTVPAERPITVQDVLSFRFGFGSIMNPGPYPIQRVESELSLKTLVPPWPPVDLTSDEWIARLGRHPRVGQLARRSPLLVPALACRRCALEVRTQLSQLQIGCARRGYWTFAWSLPLS